MPGENKTEAPEVDRTKVIREMTAEDAAILPRVVQEAVLEKAPEKKLVAEMRAALSAGEEDDLVKLAQGLVRELAELKQKAVVQEITQQVTEQVKVGSVRPIVTELVNARKPTIDKVAEVVKEIAGSDSIKALLANAVIGEMGPTQRRPGAQPGQDGDQQTGETMLDERSISLLKKVASAENGK